MRASPLFSKFLMNLYPPFLVSRIIVKFVSKDFRTVRVKIKKSFLNRNLQGSIFGGTIFSAADPFIALMYWQILKRHGINCEAWLKSAKISYLKPADSSLTVVFEISETDVYNAKEKMNSQQRFQASHTMEMRNAKGEVCATVETLVYLRIKNKKRL